MNANEKYSGMRGEIEVFYRKDGEDITVLRKSNVILNSGMDIMAKALAGELLINGMYFAYDNAGVPYTDVTPPVERTASFYHTDAGGTRNFVRAATLARPSFNTTDPAFNHNKVVFVAITTGAGFLMGPGNVLTDGVSAFYGAALAFLDPTSFNNDILFSAVSFDDLGPPHFQKIAGAQLGIRWGIFFEQP